MRSYIIELTATKYNFEENAYLSSNPDVALAVENGEFQSGYEHFEKFGKDEERKFYIEVSSNNLRNNFGLITVKERFNKPFDKDVINLRFYTEYDVCNYSCEYCIAGHNNKSGSNFNPNQYFRVINNIRKLPFTINIRLGVAGEFFISKELIEGGRLLSNSGNVKHLNLITNLSFDYKTYTKLLNGYDHDKVAIVASYHPTQIRDKKRWLDTARQINKNYDFSIVLVAYPSLLNKLPLLVNELEKKGFEVFIQEYIGIYKNKQYPNSYSSKERKILKSIMYSRHDYEFFINCKKPGLCNAGYKSLCITKDGSVLYCGKGQEIKLGNLSKNADILFFNSPRPCIHDTCFCDTENINTVIFEQHYVMDGKNQHKYSYKFERLSKYNRSLDEWKIPY